MSPQRRAALIETSRAMAEKLAKRQAPAVAPPAATPPPEWPSVRHSRADEKPIRRMRS